MDGDKNSVLLYQSFFEAASELSSDGKAELWDAIGAYFGGEEYPFKNPMAKMAWKFIKPQLDITKKKWEATRVKRSEAGKAGMRNRWNNNVITNDNNVITNDNNVITNDNNVITNDNNGITNDNNGITNDNNGITNDNYNVYENVYNKEKINKKENSGNSPLGNPSFEVNDFIEAGKDPSVALDETDAAEAYDYYAAQGFVRSNGQPITRIEPLLRAWKRNKGMFTQPANKSQTSGNLDALKAVYRSKMARDCSGYLLPSVFDNKVLETKTLDEFKTLVGTTDYEFYLNETRKPKGFK